MRDASDPQGSGPASPAPLRDASETLGREGFHCPSCNRDILTALDGVFRKRQSGSPQRFCSPSCRQAAYRRRRAGVSETVPGQFKGGRNRCLAAAGEVRPIAE